MSNKTSDKNVGSIEKDVKILNKFCEYENAVVLTDNALEEVQDSIENILAEREQKDKRILEMEEKMNADIMILIYELKQKDKQIDLMADFMYKTGTGRRALSCMFRQNDECNENGCIYCIKQYFAGLVEKE